MHPMSTPSKIHRESKGVSDHAQCWHSRCYIQADRYMCHRFSGGYGGSVGIVIHLLNGAVTAVALLTVTGAIVQTCWL